MRWPRPSRSSVPGPSCTSRTSTRADEFNQNGAGMQGSAARLAPRVGAHDTVEKPRNCAEFCLACEGHKKCLVAVMGYSLPGEVFWVRSRIPPPPDRSSEVRRFAWDMLTALVVEGRGRRAGILKTVIFRRYRREGLYYMLGALRAWAADDLRLAAGAEPGVTLGGSSAAELRERGGTAAAPLAPYILARHARRDPDRDFRPLSPKCAAPPLSTSGGSNVITTRPGGPGTT
jgi:hypothetical protein